MIKRIIAFLFRFFLIALILGLILILGARLAVFLSTNGRIFEVEQVPTEDAAPGYDEESVSPDQETPVVSDINQGADRKYYIVAGRFRNKVNADNYVSSLLTKGFNAELFRTDDDLYTVSFSSFPSRAQAEEELKRIRQTTEPDAWILLY